MADSPTPAFFDWQTDYQAVLRDFGKHSVGRKLDSAIAVCISTLREFSCYEPGFAESRNCLAALSDLLILRTLHYRYEAWRKISDVKGCPNPDDGEVSSRGTHTSCAKEANSHQRTTSSVVC